MKDNQKILNWPKLEAGSMADSARLGLVQARLTELGLGSDSARTRNCWARSTSTWNTTHLTLKTQLLESAVLTDNVKFTYELNLDFCGTNLPAKKIN